MDVDVDADISLDADLDVDAGISLDADLDVDADINVDASNVDADIEASRGPAADILPGAVVSSATQPQVLLRVRSAARVRNHVIELQEHPSCTANAGRTDVGALAAVPKEDCVLYLGWDVAGSRSRLHGSRGRTGDRFARRIRGGGG